MSRTDLTLREVLLAESFQNDINRLETKVQDLQEALQEISDSFPHNNTFEVAMLRGIARTVLQKG